MRGHAAIAAGAAGAMTVLLLGAAGVYGVWKSRGDEQAVKTRKTIQAYEYYIEGSIRAQQLVGRQLPTLETRAIDGRAVSTDFSGRKGGLVLLFKPAACQPCLITQLKSLQLLREALEDTGAVSILGISDAPALEIKRFTRAFGLEYPLLRDSTGVVLEGELGEVTPAVLLVDAHNTIIESHLPVAGRPEFSVLWYHQVRVSIREKLGAVLDEEGSSFGLSGVPYVAVIRREFDEEQANVKRVLY